MNHYNRSTTAKNAGWGVNVKKVINKSINPKRKQLLKSKVRTAVNVLVVKRSVSKSLPTSRTKREPTLEEKCIAIKHYHEQKYGELFGVDMVTECKISKSEIRYVLKANQLLKYVWRPEKNKWHILSHTHVDVVYMTLKKNNVKMIFDKKKLK